MPTDHNLVPELIAYKEIDPNIKPYWNFRTRAQGDLAIGDDVLLCGVRIAVPEELKKETLKKLHEGHQGIVRYRLRAKTAVW